MLRVLCVGSTSKDIFFPTNEGVILETPEDLTAQTKVAFELGGKFLAKDRAEAVGGVAANVAQGLSRLGILAGIYSKVGRDEIGHWAKQELERQGVATLCLSEDHRVKSDLSMIVVIEQTGDRIIFHNRDANETLEVVPKHLPPAEWYYVSALNGPWQDNLRRLLEIVRDRGVKLAFNPGQHNLKENPALIREALRETDILFLNKDEALELVLHSDPKADAKKLRSETFLIQSLHHEGASVIGLTDGKRGAWVSDGRTILHADIFEPRGLVDTTGAGDAFGSGFLAAFLWKLPLATCLKYAIANAGSVVGYYGASRGLLDQEQARTWLSRIPTVAVHETVVPVRGQ